MELSNLLLRHSWSLAFYIFTGIFRKGWWYQAMLLKRYGLLVCLERIAISAWFHGVSSIAPHSVAFWLILLFIFVLHESLQLLL